MNTLALNTQLLTANQQLAALKNKQWQQVIPFLNQLDYKPLLNLTGDYQIHIKTFHTFLDNNSWEQLRDQVLVKYQDYLIREEYRPRTINKKVSVARKLIKKLHHEGMIPFYEDVRRLTVNDQKNGYTHEEVLKIEKKMTDPMMGVLFCLLTKDALRKGEILSLTDEDLVKDGVMLQGKGQKEKVFIKLHPDTLSALRSWKPKGRLIPLDRSTINRRIERINRSLHIRYKTVHSFRHYVATYLLEQGMSLRDVQIFMRHKSPTTTKIYDDQLNVKEVMRNAHKTL